jgi:hypothetical protein
MIKINGALYEGDTAIVNELTLEDCYRIGQLVPPRKRGRRCRRELRSILDPVRFRTSVVLRGVRTRVEYV